MICQMYESFDYYWSIGAGEGNRTLVFSLEGCCSTIELHPQFQTLKSLFYSSLARFWHGNPCCCNGANVVAQGIRDNGFEATAQESVPFCARRPVVHGATACTDVARAVSTDPSGWPINIPQPSNKNRMELLKLPSESCVRFADVSAWKRKPEEITQS